MAGIIKSAKKKMIPKEIFHYTKKDIALEKILFDQKIRLSQFGLTNDPRETKEWLFPLIYTSSTSTLEMPPSKAFYETTDKVFKEAHRIISQEWKVLCVSQHHPVYHHEEPSKSTSPFHAGYCRPRMWAHYRENHTGICLKFNGVKLTEQINKELGQKYKIFHGPVTYDAMLSVAPYPIDYDEIENRGLLEGIRNYFFQYFEKYFLCKSEDWETEFEYRWLIHSNDNFPGYISINDVIEEVIVGVDFPAVYEPTLQSLCQSLKIPAGRIN